MWAREDDLIAYLPKRWRDYLRASRIGIGGPRFGQDHEGGVDKRLNTFPEDGSPPGSHYPTLRHQLLDSLHIERAILTYGAEVHPNPYFAAALARALNDWSLDFWLDGRDHRLYGSVVVANHLPKEAAKEIRRLGSHPRIAQVQVMGDGLGQPYGHPVYEAIWDAAAEVGLPIGIHLGTGYLDTNATCAGGLASTRLEFHTLYGQPVIRQLVSFILNGTFDKFPQMKVMLIEVGTTWIPWLMWTLDANYRNLKREGATLKQLPSEYLRDRVRVTTQPLELSPDRGQLIEAYEAFGGVESLLCFATDYPHWDADEPNYVATRLPREWWPRVFYENAMSFYGWQEDASHASSSIAAPVA
jgi:uncharacterized protein